MLRLSYPLRLACRAVIASRALLPITRPSVVCPPPLATAHLPTLTSQRHMITAVPASVDPGEGEGRGWRTQRRRQESRMKTREIVMTEFEGILSQASTGRGRACPHWCTLWLLPVTPSHPHRGWSQSERV